MTSETMSINQILIHKMYYSKCGYHFTTCVDSLSHLVSSLMRLYVMDMAVLLAGGVAVLLAGGVAVLLAGGMIGTSLSLIGILSFLPAEFTATTLME